MNLFILSVLLSFLVFVGDINALKCAPSACDTVRCKSPPPKCPKGHILLPSGFCLCCKSCKKILYEGGNCTAESPIAGRTSDKVVCADGLQCIGGVCKKWNPGQNC